MPTTSPPKSGMAVETKPDQTNGALSFGVDFLNKIPILWTVAIGIALIGAVYYLAAGRRHSFTPVIPAAEEAPGAAAR